MLRIDSAAADKQEGKNQLSPRQLRERLQQNLNELCRSEPSVSHVCKQTGINRQQFSKYLDGRSVPSIENIIRIANYFDARSDVLFDGLIAPTKAELTNELDAPTLFAKSAQKALDAIVAASSTKDFPKPGFYKSYVNSSLNVPALHHSIIVSLVKIEIHDSKVYFERRQYPQKELNSPYLRLKYCGVGEVINDHLSIRYCIPHMSKQIDTLLLKPLNFADSNMVGIQTGRIGNVEGGAPASTLAYYEHLGQNIDVRALIRECGFFKYSANIVPTEIAERVKGKPNPFQFNLSSEF